MATFTPASASVGVYMFDFFAWVPASSFTIDDITITAGTTAVVTDTDALGAGHDLVLTYVGSSLVASGTIPISGDFTSLTVRENGVEIGTISGIARPGNFAEIDTNNAYLILFGDDDITGSDLGDTLFTGDGGNDTVFGGGGDDTIDIPVTAGAPSHFIEGGAGNDTIFVDKNFFSNANTLDLRSSIVQHIEGFTFLNADLTVILNSSQLNATNVSLSSAIAGEGVLHVVKNLAGTFDLSPLDVAATVSVVIDGTGGGDFIFGTKVADTFRAGAGADTVNGNGGNDVFDVTGSEALSDAMNGGAGSDKLKVTGTTALVLNGFNAATSSIEVWEGNGHGLQGTASANIFNLTGLTVMSGLTAISGGAGNDTITGSKFADVFAASGTDAQFDTMNGGLGSDSFRVDGAADVTLNGFNAAAQSIEKWVGNGHGLVGNGNANVFNLAGLTSIIGLASISGGAGNDTITGSKFADVFAASGTDAQFDTMNGGLGSDTFRVDGAADLTLNGFNAAAQSIEKWVGNGHGVLGNGAANTFDFGGLTSVSGLAFVDGAGGNDVMTGSVFRDVFRSGAGNDTMGGGAGNDLLAGGLGADHLTGGLGPDVFDFDAAAEIGKKKGFLDIITDFTTGEDKIDLSTIDANGSKKGDKAFKFLKHEGSSFTHKAGQLIWDQVDKTGTANDVTLVKGDIDGNGRADFQIQLTGLVDLVKADLLL